MRNMFDGSNVSVDWMVHEGRCYSSFFEIGIVFFIGLRRGWYGCWLVVLRSRFIC